MNKAVTRTLVATCKVGLDLPQLRHQMCRSRKCSLVWMQVPRVTLYLPAEDLEPTDEFSAAINKVRTSKNLYDLWKLHHMFGQIFCAELVLGG